MRTRNEKIISFTNHGRCELINSIILPLSLSLSITVSTNLTKEYLDQSTTEKIH